MKVKKVSFLIKFALVALISITFMGIRQGIAAEETYPKREINVYIGLSAGGGADITGRVICKVMEKLLGVPIIVINKPGASTAIATAFVANSKPDGYSLLYTQTPNGVLAKIEEPSLDYSLDKLTFMGSSLRLYLYLTVRADSPWKTYEEFVNHAKKNPVKFGSTGTISPEDAFLYYFNKTVGFKEMIHVPYAGGSASARGLLAKEIDAVIQANPAVQFVKSGDFRFLAILGPERSSQFPNVPTIYEKEKRFDRFFLYRGMLMGPKGLSSAVTDKLIKAFKEAGQSKEVIAIATQTTYVPEYLTPEQCVESWKNEEKTYGEIFKKK
jgi:tripartite-type tricarboxylate transporter receptor subunit TctC